MRGCALIVVLAGCYSAQPAAGVPCDPDRTACPAGQACIAADTGHACLPIGTPPVVDARAVDAPPHAACDPSDPTLTVCFSFDSIAFGNPMPNEGRTQLSAATTNLARIAEGSGGAGLFGATSTMAVPPNTTLVDIVAFDARIRLDQPIVGRAGIIDVDKSQPGMSMFLYQTPSQLRCDLGTMYLYADVTMTVGEWVEFACSCEGNVMSAWRDGVRIAQQPGCLTSNATTNGLQIGQNSRLGDMLPPNEPFVGAIDRVRVWTAVPY